MDALDVYLNDQRVGRLSKEGRELAFIYADAYLESTSALPLSRHLPILAEQPQQIFGDHASRTFFENLLPEGDIRNQVARRLGISRENTFALLAALGGDCAGAVSLLPPGEEPTGTGRYRPISEVDLAKELDQLPAHPFMADEEGVRLSLAGAQNKLPVHYDGQTFSIPEGNFPSSHIIKTPIPKLENTVVNEAFCMNLAARLGMNVPMAEVIKLDGKTFFLIERYDRQKTSTGPIRRLHQEDFCQALGVPPAEKYEKEGGPGFVACFDLLREWSSEPLPDVAALLQWALFNFLIGNADAHGKNISFLYADGQVRLAPFYDLVSTAVYERQVNNKFAMRLGGQKDPRYLRSQNLEHFAEEAGVGLRAVKMELAALIRALEREGPALVNDFKAKFQAPVIVDRLMNVLQERSEKACFLLR